jgi:LmbE family N-acetylglucosaminyl deacetylase
MFLALRVALRRQLMARLNAQLNPMSDSEYEQSALIFAPHEDDETLGCGGTIRRKKERGAIVKIIFMTDGSASHPRLMTSSDLSQRRRQEAISAASILGIPSHDVIFLDYPDGNLMDHQATAIDAIQVILERERPSQIFIPYHREPKFIPDHQATNQIVLAAARQLQSDLTISDLAIYEYPIWFWCHWPWTRLSWLQLRLKGRIKLTIESLKLLFSLGLNPWNEFNCSVDISSQLPQKKQALDCHQSQMERFQGQSDWFILGDISGGEWLGYLLQPREIFYRHPMLPKSMGPKPGE